MQKFKDEDMKESCLIKSEFSKQCMICQEDTQYIDYISEGRLCSKECMNKFYDMVKENEMKFRDYIEAEFDNAFSNGGHNDT